LQIAALPLRVVKAARGQLLGWHTLFVSCTQQLCQNEALILETSLDLLSAPLTVPLVCVISITSDEHPVVAREAMARRRKEERRAGIAS
jgi:hypothetical protein